MERYVDGFVFPVPTDNLDTYREMAAEAGQLWINHGPLEYFEGVGDDMEPDMEGMSMRTFPQLTETGEDESVVFPFIVFESREHRDEVNAKVMDDPAMNPETFDEEMPFDEEQMVYGGFRSIVSYEE
ncbi:DUF1428 domain-containing protein [Haladaptatus salinisoli]|uniref:DUF1428 domain-containing protein n=1 Tax=Haladaptatus salinisoli TaxID=2884876 RepID=UPI001D09C582|nr:DUF1428 domain-containing protein [Haladaptatus salinisoli]